MPNYSAKCVECGTEIEYFRKIEDYLDVPQHCGEVMVRVFKAIQVMQDIAPYRAVATDVATGKPPIIGSRREHKEFLKRNNYFEVGNEKPKPRAYVPPPDPVKEIKDAIEEVRAKHNV